MWHRSLDRPAHLVAATGVGACVVLLVAIALMTGHDLARLRTIRERVHHTDRLQLLALRIERSLRASGDDATSVDPAIVRELQAEVDELRSVGLAVDPTTDHRLERLRELLDPPSGGSSPDLVAAVDLAGQAVDAEAAAQAALWAGIDADTRVERRIVVGMCVALPVLAIVAVGFVRRRILGPLGELRSKLSFLAEGDYRPWETSGAHPALAPLFSNYNQLVSRLERLEAEHRLRARSLESEVRVATRALLEQQRTLARAEKLAAIGETAASLAHELRNPLAGILMSLGNLRRETPEADYAARLDQVIAELDRLTRMLNEALAVARHSPEPARRIRLRELVADLLTLVRSQVPEHVDLECAIPAEIECRLPPDRIRQALLNLILNAVRALGEQPGSVVVDAVRRDGRLDLEVVDDGPGFPGDMLRTGIRPFSSGRPDGTGLGLAMVRRVAVDLGGEVRIGNREPRGAWVRLSVECGDD